jgi:hypothetical protein
MSEAEWLREPARPYGLLSQLQNTAVTRTKVGRRKLRLYACGCCRQIWQHIPDDALRGIIEVAERFADGNATAQELEAAYRLRGRRTLSFSEDHPDAPVDTAEALAISTGEPKPFSAAIRMSMFPLPLGGYRGGPSEANALLCRLARDVFGNPFRPVTFSPNWRTDTTVSLARQMYEAREFSAMPILADSLQDAGCDDEAILAHCRGDGPHVRGCWVVDLVLGKG